MNPRFFQFPSMFGLDIDNSYPFYDVIKISEEEFQINMALAGFKRSEINCELQNNLLTIESNLDNEELDVEYLRKGISKRGFVRKFTLPNYSEIISADFIDGILSIKVHINVPKEKRPQQIRIN